MLPGHVRHTVTNLVRCQALEVLEDFLELLLGDGLGSRIVLESVPLQDLLDPSGGDARSPGHVLQGVPSVILHLEDSEKFVPTERCWHAFPWDETLQQP